MSSLLNSYPVPDNNYEGPSDDELKRIEEELDGMID